MPLFVQMAEAIGTVERTGALLAMETAKTAETELVEDTMLKGEKNRTGRPLANAALHVTDAGTLEKDKSVN